ncbi:glycoside hydrolase family 99-like domain-containing protein [Pseudorhodoferax sp.]|uniref:glycoside hydrolase family 99-like domain-containing protein n=1 Tax=Pseudorhodoferax sp. TaxID=1993553 RepID=UPI002DD652A4|nr:glycoside hydrolase family 99-like domain-containing protein [Pseudorhodoferax sp.]
MKHLLELAGYVPGPQTGVWASPDFAGIAYSDGDEVEQRLAALIAGAEDLSVLSDELKQHITDWPSLYHLSSSRANILRPFAARLAGAQVLEIGAGCGAITRYLGESGAQVLALEGSARRAAIARTRTRDLPQVEVLAERFDQFRCSAQFDVVTLIGVLEYANQFVPGAAPALAMLQRARALLKPGGLLVIAIENQLGLKYWAGAPEDHLGVPMYGIEGRYRADQPQTYGRKQLSGLLAAAGFGHADFLSALPDYKLPVSVVTPSGLDSADFDAAALAAQCVHRDPQLPAQLAFSPEMVWPAVMRNGLGADLANSFLVAASASDASALDPAVLAYHYSTERMRDHCKQSVFKRADDGAIGVHCDLLHPATQAAPGALLVLRVPAHTPYVQGHTLASEFAQLVTQEGWSIEAVGALLRRYLDIVAQLACEGRRLPASAPVQSPLPGRCFDLVPQNIVCDPQGGHHAIDLEWTLAQDMPVGWLLFRTLLLLVQGVTRFGAPASAFDPTRRGFFLAAIRNAGIAIDEALLETFAAMEAAAQAEATRRPVEQLSNWWADAPLPMALGGGANVFNLQAVEQRMQQSEASAADLQRQLDQLAQAAEAQAERLRLESERDLFQAVEQMSQQRDHSIAALERTLHDIRSSKSWKITAPLRTVPDALSGLLSKVGLVPEAVRIGGGLLPTLRTTMQVLRAEGIGGIRWRLSNVHAMQRGTLPTDLVGSAQTLSAPVRQRVPYYPDPRWDSEPADVPQDTERFAVHCHLGTQADAAECLRWLGAIPVAFDLYVSVAGGHDSAAPALWQRALPRAQSIRMEHLPAQAQPLTALLARFGQALTAYPSFMHIAFGTADSARAAQSLLGPQGSSAGRLVRLRALMERAATLVLSADPAGAPAVRSAATVWVARVAQACGLHLDAAPTQWPLHGATAFLARGASLRDALPAAALLGQDAHGMAHEQALSDALAALLPAFASAQGERVLQIQEGDSTDDFRGYEVQRDFAPSIVHRDVKVLAYYLPQFHPTPENDEWHGKGFTEWTKVRAANPLFDGHYQQHIPHPDIGYYGLDSPDTLRRQVSQMQQAGVHGQVFYHYWFSGRMILEKPAQMLLAHPDIAMPYCFCWANENWTRRWDGNEREILLGQNYSADDARAFIRYLIPFFRDPRYIRVGTRPMLLVYRPSSMPNPAEYIGIWAEECAQAGIDAPYMVAVLTRGATDPRDFGMDAGTERVLHDWTGGAVADVRASLQAYWPMNGGVLPYDQVRDFYTAQNDRKPFVYFRSNVPMWDNTARYGSEALLLHGSTPQGFQRWMEHSIADAQAHLEADRRFVFVNAWNEWAEGTHLEPDTRYGYSYLNSVGRALSGLPYAHERNAGGALPDGVRLQLSFAPALLRQLRADAPLRRRFFRVLARSQLLREQGLCLEATAFGDELAWLGGSGDASAGTLQVEFQRAIHCAADAIESMARTAWATQAQVIGNDYGQQLASPAALDNGAVPAGAAALASVRVRPVLPADPVHPPVRMRSDAWCFALPATPASGAELPVVTTIVRFHRSARLEELRSAMACLHTMEGCTVVPLIAAQDLDEAQTAALQAMLAEFDWPAGFEPRVDHHVSANGRGDLRARMLNLSLQRVTTRYAAFLDYDDLLFPDAYAWLIQRLRDTGKAVAFGRVYWAGFSSCLSAITSRRQAFEYGGTYEEFVCHNHAPLHSVLLDVEQLDPAALVYFDDQRYMEDYLMTLQLFRADNGDWEGLQLNHYVGDYVHSTDRRHTLAIDDDAARKALLRDPEYMLCEQRIAEMRNRIAAPPRGASSA